MDLYTQAIRATDAAWVELEKRAQTTMQPFLLTKAGTTEPAFVVMKVDLYEKIQRQEQRFYQLQLLHLKQWLDHAEQRWEDQAIRTECIAYWKENLPSLWEVCPEPSRGLCASLMLAVQQLDVERFSQAQIAALRVCVALLQSVRPCEQEIDQAYLLLMRSGIPPKLSFDQSIIQSYIDEL